MKREINKGLWVKEKIKAIWFSLGRCFLIPMGLIVFSGILILISV